MQGYRDAGRSVYKFILQQSNDGMTWHNYKNNGRTIEFIGNSKTLAFTKVNWFMRTFSRFIRVVPTARAPNSYHCMRIELFGCSSKGPIVINNLIHPAGAYVGHENAGNVLFYSIAPVSKNITTTISVASGSTTLAKSSDRFQFYNSCGKIKNTSTLVVDETSVQGKLLNHDSIGIIAAAAQASFTLLDEDYYEFNVSTMGKVRIALAIKRSGRKEIHIRKICEKSAKKPFLL